MSSVDVLLGSLRIQLKCRREQNCLQRYIKSVKKVRVVYESESVS